MIWDDNTPRKLLSEDGYVMVATMPSLTDDHGTVCPITHHYPIKNTDLMNSRLTSPIAFLIIPNMCPLILANRLPVLTKLVNMWTDLEKCVVK
jgi:hypothetical protein